MGIIDEKTHVPLFAVLIALPAVTACVVWMADVNSRGEANAQRISEHERQLDSQMGILSEIRDRVIRIEEQIKKVQRGH
jgi:hypothetical protein